MTDCCIMTVRFLSQAKEYLDIWPSRKTLKRLLQNIHLMLDLLYHARILLITIIADDSIFLKCIAIMKLCLTPKHISQGVKSFLNYFASKMILLNIFQNSAIYLLFCFTHHDNIWKLSCIAWSYKMILWQQDKLNSKWMFGWLIVSSF